MDSSKGRGAYPHPANSATDSRQKQPPAKWDSGRLLRELRNATVLG